MLAEATIAISLLALGSNVWFWLRALKGYLSWRRMAAQPPPAQWPRAHIFVCLKGRLPRIAETATALATQDYAGLYRVTFVTEADAAHGDPAAADLAACMPPGGRCDHVVAGRVLDRNVRCAQKNHNLLAGIAHAEEHHPGVGVFAFCDGDLLVTPSWLTEMVRPIATGASDLSTGFHWVAGQGRSVVSALHGLAEACQSMAALVCRGATWGGSLAMRASVFREQRLHETWGRTVVDDMALSRAIKRLRLRVAAVPRFLVQTHSDIASYRDFIRWLGRQYFFVKVYLPSLYGLLWMKTAIEVAALWLAVWHLGWRLAFGAWPAGWLPAVIVFMIPIGQALALHLFRYVLPERPPARSWISASFLAPGASLLACLKATGGRRRLVWRDVSYVLGRDGCVADVAPAGASDPEETLATEAA